MSEDGYGEMYHVAVGDNNGWAMATLVTKNRSVYLHMIMILMPLKMHSVNSDG